MSVPSSSVLTGTPDSSSCGYEVIRRNGGVVAFIPDKIAIALKKAFCAVEGDTSVSSSRVQMLVAQLTDTVVHALTRRLPAGGTLFIEDIQDQVELALMRAGEHDVARTYVLYREKRTEERMARERTTRPILHVLVGNERQPLNEHELLDTCRAACAGRATVSAEVVCEQGMRSLYDGVPLTDVRQALVLSARALIEKEPDYSFVAARLLLLNLGCEVIGHDVMLDALPEIYTDYFSQFIARGLEAGLLDARLAEFDLKQLAAALQPERDQQFGYLGLQTLYDRYFLHIDGRRIELPQIFFMRVAMGLALNEPEREQRAIEFYHVLSRFDFMCSTPTLFNSGTRHSQLSSCYLTTVDDDLDSIFQVVKDNALLQKFAGGLGNDWTPVRALGAHIKGTNGNSQGVIPFLKVVNDTAVAVNQGGKRKGAVCAYLETWHLDIEEFLELRKNTGDERRRAHDMNTAHWIPDLFMQRVAEAGMWTLFSPDEVPYLHECYGKAFNAAYLEYERRADKGQIKLFKRIPALELWRKMLTMLYETGHPWLTFKDPCNIRSPQRHAGVVHSSNLCTEITLNTSLDEIAVCNLGSVNLAAHMHNGELDTEQLRRTIRTAMRMLDNVIDVNFYAVDKARQSNLRHRPVGLGIMGFADALKLAGMAYDSDAALTFADRSMEAVCYHAYLVSSELAKERGRYASYEGSQWSQGTLPPDTLQLLETERGQSADLPYQPTQDWEGLREHIRMHGMRHSNCVAIAPTATIANIVGVSPSIEPDYQNVYVKSNLSGEFTVINPYLVRELKAHHLWDEAMAADLKYFDGALSMIDRVPAEVRNRYVTAFEMDPVWLVEAAARRQRWIDQAQSLNLYVTQPSGKKLDELYRLAWKRGLKTTYYLRTLGASQQEKLSGRHENSMASKVCVIDNPDCEACQ